jgi:hypothetical protein
MIKPKTINLGHFPAKYLWAFQPFVDWQRNSGTFRFLDGSIFMEPARQGGAYIGALCSVAMAVIYDKEAQISAPVTLAIPDAAFEIARGPKPVSMVYENDSYCPPVPEWMQPDDVFVSDAGMFITTKMRHPHWVTEHKEFYPALFQRIASSNTHSVGLDYKMTPGTPGDWRRVIEGWRDANPSTNGVANFAPEIGGLFSRIHQLFTEQDEVIPSVWHTSREETNGASPGILVTIENHPTFLGTFMPMRSNSPHELPAHFFERMDLHTASETKQ